jgi:predicted MFS family arabinose efflux permease
MDLSSTRNRSRLFTLDVAFLVAAGAGATAIAGALVGRIEPAFHVTRESALTIVLVLGAVVTGASAVMYAMLDLRPAARKPDGPRAAAVAIPTNVILLVALSGLWLAGLTLATPFFNVYFARTFDLSIERVGWIFSATTVTTALLLTGAGEVATRFGARGALVLWLALFAPAMWGLALAPSLGIAAACYQLQGLVSPAANPLLDQLMLEGVPVERRGVVSSWRQAMASGGQVLAQSLGGTVLAAGSFTLLFAFAGSVGLVAGGAVAVVAWRVGRR